MPTFHYAKKSNLLSGKESQLLGMFNSGQVIYGWEITSLGSSKMIWELDFQPYETPSGSTTLPSTYLIYPEFDRFTNHKILANPSTL